MSRRYGRLFTFAIVLLSAALCAGQTTRGTIAGVVTDVQGAVVNGAKVTVTSAALGETRSTTTSSNGEYRVDALTPGTYTVAIEASGFAKATVQNVTVRTSQITSSNIQMELASKQESIVVEANVETVQTESGELSKTIPTAEVKDLPIVGGNPFLLATTLPGVSTVNNRDVNTNGAGFSVNGLRPRDNNFLIDGFDDNDNGISGQAFQPTNQEAIQEVTVLTNAYSAEYGRGGASVSNLSFKSGTNVFHGAGWYSYDGSRLDALSSEQSTLNGDTRVPQYTNNLWGFRLGGPVVKNKLFLFGTSQWNHILGASTTQNTLTIPTAAGVSALQSIGPNQNISTMLTSIGSLRGIGNPHTINVGDRPGCGSPCLIEVGDITRQDHTATRTYEWTVRGDYLPTSSDTIYARFTNSYNSFSPDLFANPSALPIQDTQQSGPSRLFGTMWAHTFNQNTINEFRFSAQQIDFGFNPLPATLTSPLASLPTEFLASTLGNPATSAFFGGWSAGTFPQGRGHKTFQFQDAVSLTRGNHSFKIGTDLAVLLIKDRIPFNNLGTITYAKGGTCMSGGVASTCTDFANFIDDFTGTAGTINKQFGNALISVPTTQQAFYFQDSWKLRPNLTLDYGVRYEYQPPDASNVLPYPAIDRATILTEPLQTRHEVKPDRNNFGPRVGFAYTPHWGKALFGDNKTVVRGGYGIFYDVFFTNISNNTAATSPNTLGGNQVGGPTARGTANATAFLNSIAPTLGPKNLQEAATDNLTNPQIHQWNLNVQRELPGGLIAEVAYVGTRAEHLWVNEQLNPIDFNTGQRLAPTKGSIIVRGNRGDSNYHGLQATVSRSVKNLTLRGSYTWSRSIDNQSEVFATSGGASRWENVLDPRSDRGPSAFNRTQRAAITYVYDLPSLRHHGLLTAALGGWETSGTLQFETGTPETVYIGGYDQNGDGEAFNDRPMLGNTAVPINYTPACVSATTACSGVGQVNPDGSIVDWITGASTVDGTPGGTVLTAKNFHYLIYPQGSGVNGNVSRNSFNYPGRQDYNLSLMKRFNLPYREGHTFELRGDFFNAFNHPNEGVINLSGDLNDLNFQNLPRSRSGGRTITLWAKYYF